MDKDDRKNIVEARKQLGLGSGNGDFVRNVRGMISVEMAEEIDRAGGRMSLEVWKEKLRKIKERYKMVEEIDNVFDPINIQVAFAKKNGNHILVLKSIYFERIFRKIIAMRSMTIADIDLSEFDIN